MAMYIVLVSLATASGGPKLLPPTAAITKNDPVILTLSSPSTVYIDGCAPIELERKVGEQWELVASKVCPRAAPATRVDGALTLTAPSVRDGEYRATVGWGQTCTDGVPFHLAMCRKFGLARTESFFVGAPPPPPVPPP